GMVPIGLRDLPDPPPEGAAVATETIELTGHIVDSLILAKVLDTIVEAGVDYELVEVDIGRTNIDPSRAVIEMEADQATLDRLLDDLRVHGANRLAMGEA